MHATIRQSTPVSSQGKPPLVSVVTPLYNGEKYIVECIESVLAQSYENWEYIILDNCSSDGSLATVREYERKESRIKVHTNNKVMPVMQNWNRALSLIDVNSKYCKIVHADDWIFPQCLESMVDMAETHPNVGLVSAYRLDENWVNLDGLPYSSTVLSGREVCRSRLIGGRDLFGSPTSLLYRADLVRSRAKFYNEANLHADTEVCFELLQHSDFGFIHQVLTYTRRHNESESSFARIVNTHKFNHLYVAIEYGRIYLNKLEYRNVCKRQWKIYYRSLGRNFLKLVRSGDSQKRKEFWRFHRGALRRLGYKLNLMKFVGSVFVVLYNQGLRRLIVS